MHLIWMHPGAPVNVTWFNTNGYLKGTFSMPENVTVIGGKTGTTEAAGSCLILYSKISSLESHVFQWFSRAIRKENFIRL